MYHLPARAFSQCVSSCDLRRCNRTDRRFTSICAEACNATHSIWHGLDISSIEAYSIVIQIKISDLAVRQLQQLAYDHDDCWWWWKLMMTMMTYDDDDDLWWLMMTTMTMMTNDKSVDFQDRARSPPLPGWLLAWPKIDVPHNSVSVSVCATQKCAHNSLAVTVP